MKLKQLPIIALFLVPATGFSGGWDLRVGVSQFPDQDTLLAVELTRVVDLAAGMDLGLGGVARTNFGDTWGLGGLARFRYWFIENIAIGASGELGYVVRSNATDFGYTILGPLLGLRVEPFFAQWEPGFIIYHSASLSNARGTEFMPLRFIFGISF